MGHSARIKFEIEQNWSSRFESGSFLVKITYLLLYLCKGLKLNFKAGLVDDLDETNIFAEHITLPKAIHDGQK